MKRLGDLAELLNAQLVGDPEILISDAKTTARANSTDITFACSEKHFELFLALDAPAVVVNREIDIQRRFEAKACLIVDDAEAGFEKLVTFFRPPPVRNSQGISKHAIVADTAQISDNVDIGPGSYIGEDVQIGSGTVIFPNVTILDGAIIGSDTTIFPNVVIYEKTIIGHRCLIHGGAVLGAYGFGYKSNQQHILSAQLGNVVIGDDVEIGSNTTIDRGTYDSTTIGDGTKLDDLVMIGHNCKIGKHNLLCSQVGIAGSTETGDYVVMAGQVGIGDHLEIADNVTIAAQSGVMHNLAGGKVYLGSPAIPAREQMQLHATVAKLPELRKQLRAIQKTLDDLTGKSKITSDAA